MAQYGYSRDQREGNRQILLGVVMANGWPIAHHVFRGNRHDSETVLPIVADLEKRFGLRRIVFVGDRGMVSTANLGFLWSQGHGFLFGLRRRRSPEVLEYVRKAQSGSWQPCSPEEKDRVCEVEGALPGQRIFVVESAERLAYEQAMRERDVTKTREELGKLAKRIEKGELRNREEIGSSVARILSPSRPPLLPLESAGRQAPSVRRAGGDRKASGGEVRDPHRGKGSLPARGGPGLQGALRGGKSLPEAQGRPGASSDLPPQSQTGAGARLRRRLGLPARPAPGEEAQGGQSTLLQRASLGCPPNHPSGGFLLRKRKTSRGHRRESSGPANPLRLTHLCPGAVADRKGQK
ncbi:protein of unknown function [Methylacidimicrobium sp. AP8]|nr:protein of unknown function [Methylacidimicrobium sp. AP8]